MSDDGEQILALAREVKQQGGGMEALRAVLHAPDLSVTAKACIQRALDDEETKKGGGWPFRWW